MAEAFHTNYEIRWKNFRRFEDTGWLVIKPLTILLGANNAGKSSIISPLLLVSQTISSNDIEVPLLPFGSLIDLGNYKDFVHLHETKREVFLGMRFHIHKTIKKLRAVGLYPPGGIELTFAAGKKAEQMRLKQVDVTDIYNRLYFSRVASEKGYSLAGAIPFDLMKDKEKKAVESTEPMNFLFSPTNTIYELESGNEETAKRDTFSKHFSHYLRAVGFTSSFLQAIFKQLSYIGPLRTKLARFYRVSPEVPDTVGSQGEHAANLFRRRTDKLKAKVDAWVKRFEFGDELTSVNLTDDLFQLVFKSGKEESNVADAGFGASQVLPLIIQAAAAPQDSLTIAEQPEIHLNPRLQCVLADLFVDMATSGHRVIVETHSEHIIVRLRRLIADGKIAANQVNLLFVEKIEGKSSIREIEIKADGSIERDAWPKGFFEDGLREAFSLATSQAEYQRKNAKKRKQNAAS